MSLSFCLFRFSAFGRCQWPMHNLKLHPWYVSPLSNRIPADDSQSGRSPVIISPLPSIRGLSSHLHLPDGALIFRRSSALRLHRAYSTFFSSTWLIWVCKWSMVYLPIPWVSSLTVSRVQVLINITADW